MQTYFRDSLVLRFITYLVETTDPRSLQLPEILGKIVFMYLCIYAKFSKEISNSLPTNVRKWKYTCPGKLISSIVEDVLILNLERKKMPLSS